MVTAVFKDYNVVRHCNSMTNEKYQTVSALRQKMTALKRGFESQRMSSIHNIMIGPLRFGHVIVLNNCLIKKAN